ncbi:DUF3467 domain-containing protein [Methylobacterium sp. WL8]|uniref:DUF3467 domain-containing protein n=1 Tax=Methylobacterium sp. WL8 TaxID=2603899 RepID=UPI001FEF15A7|nr:DUF3467 domain-containing protein [Methylobacterium sp. WL8]
MAPKKGDGASSSPQHETFTRSLWAFRSAGRLDSERSRGTDLDKTADSTKDDEQARAIAWRETDMATHFANVVNVQGTREQVDLFFGTNRTWNVTDVSQVVVDLSNRIILTPLAAKRLLSVLGGVLAEYETRHGRLDLEA